MGLRNWPVFRAGVFRQAKYLITSPQKAHSALAITEPGVVGIDNMPMKTGFITANDKTVKKAWAVIHALKFKVYHDGKPTDMESTVVISERNYKPLDPLNILKPKDRERLASLKDIAKVQHAQERSRAGAADNYKDIATFIIQGCFLLLGLEILAAIFIKGC